MENDYSREVYEEDRLPMFHRTIKLPHGLWDKVKERGNQEQKALRWIVDDALDAELLPLVTLAFQAVFQTACAPFGFCRGHEKIGSGVVMSTPPPAPVFEQKDTIEGHTRFNKILKYSLIPISKR